MVFIASAASSVLIKVIMVPASLQLVGDLAPKHRQKEEEEKKKGISDKNFSFYGD